MPIASVDRSTLQLEPIDWRGLHREYLNPGEMEIIAALVRSGEARSMIEIGCRDGRTARILLDNVLTLERYVGIDVPIDYQPALPSQRSEMVEQPGLYANLDPRFELKLSPQGSLDLDELEPCDVVFIDGDHSGRVVEHDTALALSATRTIIWHDYLNDRINDVTAVVLKLSAAGWPITHIAGTWLAFCRI